LLPEKRLLIDKDNIRRRQFCARVVNSPTFNLNPSIRFRFLVANSVEASNQITSRSR